jgi:hypothetical protein
MRTRLLLALACAALIGGCKGKKGGTTEPAAAATDPAAASGQPLPGDALWALAPDGTAFGLVITEGSGERLIAAAAAAAEVMAERPDGAALYAKVRTELSGMPFHPLDLEAWRQNTGLDPVRGAALFMGAGGDPLGMVLPVTDRAAFRELFEWEQATVDGRDLDRDPGGEGVCAPIGDHYACAENPAGLDAMAAGGALGRFARELPVELRGDVQLVANLGRFPGAVRELVALRPAMNEIRHLSLSARLDDRGTVVVRGWMEGRRTGPVGIPLGEIAANPAINGFGDGAVGVVRVRAPLGLLWARAEVPPALPVGGVDLRSALVDNLTGEVTAYTRGTGLVGGELLLGLRDPDAAQAAIEALCGLVRNELALPLSFEAGRCQGRLPAPDVSGEDAALRALVEALPTDVSVGVRRGFLEISDAEGRGARGVPDVGPTSAEAKELLVGDWHLAAWGLSLDPLATAPAPVAAALTGIIAQAPEDVRPMIEIYRWAAGNLHELGGGVALRADGLHGMAFARTFGADPEPVRRQHRAALGRLLDGDHDGYRAALAKLGAAHGDTLAARQARAVEAGAPSLGFGLSAASLVPWLVFSGGEQTLEGPVGIVEP